MRRLREKALDALAGIASGFGGFVTSARAQQRLLSQRARAVSELVELEQHTLRPGITGIVFSKDRALQLYTLLHTYQELVDGRAPLTVVYTASTAAHADAYAELEAESQGDFPKVSFVPEGSGFRETLIHVLSSIDTRSLFFLVDDIVFIRPLDLGHLSEVDPRQTIVSFRHSPHLRRSYTANVAQMPPRFLPSAIGPDLLEFKWFEESNEWSNPWSVDGQILSTAELRVFSRLSEFRAPNTYEGALKTFDDFARGRRGACYRESRILNLPINRVQHEVQNESGGISTEFLLDQWKKGMMLDTRGLRAHIPLSPHEEFPITFIRRSAVSRP